MTAPPSRSGYSRLGSLHDEGALELADRTEDVKEKLPGRSPRVDSLIQNHEIDTEAIKFLGQGGKVPDAACKTIQLYDHQRGYLAAAGAIHELIEGGAGVLAAGHTVVNEPLRIFAPPVGVSFEFVELGF
jgi:hypothetical protein